jgi:hypothetical protein
MASEGYTCDLSHGSLPVGNSGVTRHASTSSLFWVGVFPLMTYRSRFAAIFRTAEREIPRVTLVAVQFVSATINALTNDSNESTFRLSVKTSVNASTPKMRRMIYCRSWIVDHSVACSVTQSLHAPENATLDSYKYDDSITNAEHRGPSSVMDHHSTFDSLRDCSLTSQ